MTARRPVALLTVLALAAPLAACGRDDDEKQVRETLDRFATATQRKDYQQLCDELLAPELVEQVKKVNLPCEVALRTGLGDVQKPQLKVGKIEVEGKTASATVETTAANQKPSSDVVRLVKRGDEWRISSLASPGE